MIDWNKEASDLVKLLLNEANMTQVKAAEVLGIKHPSLTYKLSKGTLRLPEFLKLLKYMKYEFLISDEDYNTIFCSSDAEEAEIEEKMLELQKRLFILTDGVKGVKG